MNAQPSSCQSQPRATHRVFINAPRDVNGQPVHHERTGSPSPRPQTISGKRGEWVPAPYPYGSWPPHAGMLVRRVVLSRQFDCAPVEPVVEMLEEGDGGWWVTVANDYASWVRLAAAEDPKPGDAA